ncbi:MAG: hypothetical protein ACRDJW_22705 [Thermomicrobiales bacterium]
MSITHWLLHWTVLPLDSAPGGGAGRRAPDHKIVRLAALWPPFDARSGIVQNPTPVGADVIEEVERTGYVVVAPVHDQAPYTHVISTGNHDYLAALDTQTTPSETL